MQTTKWLRIFREATTLAAVTIALAVGARAQTETVLYSFTGGADGNQPNGVIADGAGNLYGTTTFGGNLSKSNCGSNGCGTVFELSPAAGGWQLTTLYTFNGGADGLFPVGNLARDQSGNLYGVTFAGGALYGPCHGYGGCGVVFEVSPASSGWVFTVLHTFRGADGAIPYSGLTLDSSGNLYGTTSQGGQPGCVDLGCGVVFELSPTSSGWIYKSIHIFAEAESSDPQAGVILDPSGNLYSATVYGGSILPNYGTVFELSPISGGGWGKTILHGFSARRDGWYGGNLIFDTVGNLYGATQFAGDLNACNHSGCGVVFQLSQDSTGWKDTVLHTFTGPDGWAPASLILEKSGNLYGATAAGGNFNNCYGNGNGCGVVFKLSPSSQGWQENVLYNFHGNTDGESPVSIIAGPDGSIYGATLYGGGTGCYGYGCGTVFQLKP